MGAAFYAKNYKAATGSLGQHLGIEPAAVEV